MLDCYPSKSILSTSAPPRSTNVPSGDNYHVTRLKQNRSTEGCSKLKRSVDMTISGKNGLNIRTNVSPK